MNIEQIKDKIKKLLALSEDNPSDAEGFSAMQKAQELMAKYKLEMADVSDKEDVPRKCIKENTHVSYGTRSSDHYLNELAGIIADNFCCINYISTPRGSRTHNICFMGYEEDVAIAIEVLHTANRAIIKGYNRVYKSLQEDYGMDYVPAYYFNPAKVGYIDGYLEGLKKALEDQKEQNQEWGLVLVTPKEAQDFLDGLTHATFGGVTKVDKSYYQEGYNDGTNFQLNKKLDNRSNNMIDN